MVTWHVSKPGSWMDLFVKILLVKLLGCPSVSEDQCKTPSFFYMLEPTPKKGGTSQYIRVTRHNNILTLYPRICSLNSGTLSRN